MMTTSKPLFVYLQRPGSVQWVTVGRYTPPQGDRAGAFRYAQSYIEAGHTWSIDPINIPLIGGVEHQAYRYQGLHDVLRDTTPDAWGRLLLQRQHQLSDNAPDIDYLRLARNGDRWGALAVGPTRTPSVDFLKSPQLIQLEGLTQELLAMFERRAPVDAKMRRMLMTTPSMGGARPKGTLHDGEDYWLVKPILATDTVDVPLLEHVTLQWGREAGMDFARSAHHQIKDGLSVIRVLRFDRHGEGRSMAISAASLLSTEYPGGTRANWSYSLLAQTLQKIGCPQQDRIELFNRMVFNAVVGNDDDHPRNHAAIYHAHEGAWRLSPAFDVVPNPDEEPRALTMQLSEGRFDISREAILADALHFGFEDATTAHAHLNALLGRIEQAFHKVEEQLSPSLKQLLLDRLAITLRLLA